MSEPTHILLTGRPGVGKTTALQAAAALLPEIRLGGFLTREIREGSIRSGFFIETFEGERRTLARTDIVSPHRVGRYGVDLSALEALAERALAPEAPVDLFFLDEIGKMECLSPLFCDAVRRLLDSGRPLVATVAQNGAGLMAEVKAREDIVLFEVTQANRDRIPARIAAWARRLLAS